MSSSARYGGYAMEVLLNQLFKLGAHRGRLVAKVFGGAAVLRGFSTMNVGEANSAFVLDYLANEKIRLEAQGPGPLSAQGLFFSHLRARAGQEAQSVHNYTILEREQEYGTRLKSTSIADEVELFT